MNLQLQDTPLAGVYTVETTVRADERGQFFRAFCATELRRVLGGRAVRQLNVSKTMQPGAVRGLHFQRPPGAEMKLIRCLRGRVWDVAVDIRVGSPTYLKWFAQELSEQNYRMMIVPEGCAHGFQVLEPGSQMLYVHTADYEPALEGGLRYDDPALAIAWPLPVGDLSDSDRRRPYIGPGFEGVSL